MENDLIRFREKKSCCYLTDMRVTLKLYVAGVSSKGLRDRLRSEHR